MVCLDLTKIERNLKVKEVQIPELGGSIYVKEMSGQELMILEDDIEKKGNGTQAILLFGVCKEDGSRMFNTNDEVKAFLGKISGRVLYTITTECSKMNTMLQVEEEAKN